MHQLKKILPLFFIGLFFSKGSCADHSEMQHYEVAIEASKLSEIEGALLFLTTQTNELLKENSADPALQENRDLLHSLQKQITLARWIAGEDISAFPEDFDFYKDAASRCYASKEKMQPKEPKLWVHLNLTTNQVIITEMGQPIFAGNLIHGLQWFLASADKAIRAILQQPQYTEICRMLAQIGCPWTQEAAST